MRRKRRWKDMGTAERVVVLVLLAVSLAIVGSAQRDLSQRSDDEVNGDKRIWRLVCLNALGALGYYRWGRRAAA
jgi:hypothetical protein